ncbi:MAG: family intrarane metalloprotease [Mucilaginibacter sp.]|nr:family intrarane metalloprotease [Mucilaginibacter sp.]
MNKLSKLLNVPDITDRRYRALIVLGIILPFFLYVFLSYMFLSSNESLESRLIISRLIIWGVFGLLFLYAYQAEVQQFLLWGESKYNFSFYIKAIIALYLLGYVMGIIAHIPVWFGFHENKDVLLKMAIVMKQHPLFMYFTAITAGITEELIFRGYMLSRLSLLFKQKYLPIVISAMLFAVVHLAYKNPIQLVYTFLLGLLYGAFYQKYRNIKILIGVHSMVDITAFSVLFAHIKH